MCNSSLLLLLVVLVCVKGVIFEVPANDQVCLGEELGYDMVVHATWAAQEGKGSLLITATHHNEDNGLEGGGAGEKTVVSKDGVKGSFGFTTEQQGEYRFCFSSKWEGAPPNAVIEVDFDLKVGYETKDYQEIARKEHLQPVEVEVVKLIDEARELLNEMRFIHTREQDHRRTTDSTNTAVVGWSALSMIIIVVLGLYQTFYLRQYFRKKKLIN